MFGTRLSSSSVSFRKGAGVVDAVAEMGTRISLDRSSVVPKITGAKPQVRPFWVAVDVGAGRLAGCAEFS